MSTRLRAIATETVAIVKHGSYRHASGDEVEIAELVQRARAGTRLYLPEDEITIETPEADQPVVELTRETTLVASRRLGGRVAALVFASAKNPGGGFRSGAKAQEESLARASALHASLERSADFYAFHRAQRDLRYSDRVIYSPDVPVFRDDHGELLPQPFLVSFLTAAAPNRRALMQSRPDLADSVTAVMRNRVTRVLQLAAAHGHRRLVLGAWGCGVFGNEPDVVARAFADALAESPWFDQIVFAVHDSRPNQPAYRAFADIFG